MKIAFFNSYVFDPKIERLKTYRPLMENFLLTAWPEAEITTFECPQNEFPKKLQFDLFVFGGSPKGAYEPDHWILRLKKLIRNLHERRKKMLGICFGHQLLASALGGEVRAFPGGWEVGTHSARTSTSSDQLGLISNQNFSLLYIHQDQITRLPETAHVLAANDFCRYQMFALDDNVLGIQGHPEFTPDYLKEIINARRDDMPAVVADEALESLKLERDESQIIEWVRKFARKSTGS